MATKSPTSTKRKAPAKRSRLTDEHMRVSPEGAYAAKVIANVMEGVERLTSSKAELHRQTGENLLALLASTVPRLFSAWRASRKAWRKPDAKAVSLRKHLLKRWSL